MDLYGSTQGENWKSSTRWLEGDPCSDLWFGVLCVDGAITTLYACCCYETLPHSHARVGRCPTTSWLALYHHQLVI